MVVLRRAVAPCSLVLACALSGLSWLSCTGAPDDEAPGQTEEALQTFPNEKPAFDFFRAKGLTPVQSASIVGNLDVESGIDPTIAQPNGPGRGIAQWSVGGRWDTIPGDNVKAYAAQKGQSATSLQLQLDFIWFELVTFPAYGLAALRTKTTTAGAVAAFAKDFEGCGSCKMSLRVAYADSVLARFGNGATDGGASAAPCSLDGGRAGVCVSTSECAARGRHVSTPGLCPGSKDIQCCTPDGTEPASGSEGPSGAPEADGGEPPANGEPPASGEDDAPGGVSSESSGCAASNRRATGTGVAVVFLAAATLAQRRRRRAPPGQGPRA
jgi:hypothetical protein